MPETIYHPRTRHSLEYYHAILLALIEGQRKRLAHKQIAELLNSRGLLSPTGQPWSQSSVKLSLHKLRNHETIRSSLHSALLELCFAGKMRPSDALCLFEQQKPSVM